MRTIVAERHGELYLLAHLDFGLLGLQVGELEVVVVPIEEADVVNVAGVVLLGRQVAFHLKVNLHRAVAEEIFKVVGVGHPGSVVVVSRRTREVLANDMAQFVLVALAIAEDSRNLVARLGIVEDVEAKRGVLAFKGNLGRNEMAHVALNTIEEDDHTAVLVLRVSVEAVGDDVPLSALGGLHIPR